jgi:hypothetical protein
MANHEIELPSVELVPVVEAGNQILYQNMLNAESKAAELKGRFPSARFFIKPYGAYFQVLCNKGEHWAIPDKEDLQRSHSPQSEKGKPSMVESVSLASVIKPAFDTHPLRQFACAGQGKPPSDDRLVGAASSPTNQSIKSKGV